MYLYNTGNVKQHALILLDVQAEAKKKKGYQIGGVVGSGASVKKSIKCSPESIGKSAACQESGCEHPDCTTAKNAARAALRNLGLVPEECYPYIHRIQQSL